MIKKQQIEEEIARLRKVTIKPEEHVHEIMRETEGIRIKRADESG